MANSLKRDQAMYDALANSASRALEEAFKQMDNGKSLVEMTADVKLSQQERLGWNCSVVSPREIKAFSLGIIQGLDALAAYWEVDAHPTYLKGKQEVVDQIMALKVNTPSAIQDLEKDLAWLRGLVMKVKIQVNEDNEDKLYDIAQDFVQAYAIAQEDPTIMREYEDLTAAVLNGNTTSTALKELLERFVAKLPEFQQTSRSFMNDMITHMHAEAEAFDIDQSPQLMTFFQEVNLQLSVASKPEEFIAIGRLLERLEPMLTEKIITVSDMNRVRDYVTGLVMTVKEAHDNGVEMSDGADKVLDICRDDLANPSIDRDGYADVLRKLRTVQLADA